MKILISSRELEILRKSADGLSISQIASDLDLAPQIVTASKKQILQKTESRDVIDALLALAKNGFILKDNVYSN